MLVIFCGDDEAHAGAIELWHNDPAEAMDLTLADGYYGTTGDAFEFLSRRTAFRRAPACRAGLGQRHARSSCRIWARARASCAATARSGGHQPRLRDALRQHATAEHYVMAFLSALATPIVRRFEVWEPDAASQRLVRMLRLLRGDGVLERRAAGASSAAKARWAAPSSPACRRSATTSASEPGGWARPLQRRRLQSLVAVPVLREGRCSAVVAWYF